MTYIVTWRQHAIDSANTLKAFVGTNYLGLAYGFSQSGLGVSMISFEYVF